jgi:hypothetical protein
MEFMFLNFYDFHYFGSFDFGVDNGLSVNPSRSPEYLVGYLQYLYTPEKTPFCIVNVKAYTNKPARIKTIVCPDFQTIPSDDFVKHNLTSCFFD